MINVPLALRIRRQKQNKPTKKPPYLFLRNRHRVTGEHKRWCFIKGKGLFSFPLSEKSLNNVVLMSLGFEIVVFKCIF